MVNHTDTCVQKVYFIQCVIFKYRLYNEDEGLSNIHNRGRSPRTCIFDDPESELYNRLVPECGGVIHVYTRCTRVRNYTQNSI